MRYGTLSYTTRACCEAEIVRTPQTNRASLVGASVLIAEDNLVNLEVARFHLEDLGCVAMAALNGAEALDLAQRYAFDFILMDCQMPVMDGFAARAAIRALDPTHKNATTPIFAVTAADDAQSQRFCAIEGFDGFLAKPFTAMQLEAALLGCGGASVSSTPAPTAAQRHQCDREYRPLLDRVTFTAFVEDFGLATSLSLIASLTKSLEESVGKFDQYAEVNDVAGLRALGHKLAGAAGTVGAQRLAALSKKIDVDGKKGQLAFTTEVRGLRELIIGTLEIFAPMQSEGGLSTFLSPET
jgi:two-component system, sensor histidine kinase and response regulator